MLISVQRGNIHQNNYSCESGLGVDDPGLSKENGWPCGVWGMMGTELELSDSNKRWREVRQTPSRTH